MYKKSVSICLLSVNESNMHVYLDMIKKCKVDRVFICGLGYVCTKQTILYTNTQLVKNVISYFKNNGLEVGVWIESFGHGGALVGESLVSFDKYTKITGVDGKTAHTICPNDENFIKDYADALKLIASFNPDLIMFDDDFRINGRMSYYLGCFCDYHYNRYCQLVGEVVPKEDLERLITTGGKNKYRDAYYDMIAETLIGFAKKMRSAVNEVNKNIRLGASFSFEAWDTSGTSLIEIAKALAGDTKPFARIAGAPYWSNNIINVVEASRLEFFYGKNSDVELFAEGDTYPRPRYNVASKPLELFELLLIANNDGNGLLSYIFDYIQKPDYETGYVKRFIKNEDKRLKVQEFFKDKKPVGVRVFSARNKVRNATMPSEVKNRSFGYFDSIRPFIPASDILSKNSIPTCYYDSDYPVLAFGEDAKQIDLSLLKNGVITDVLGAKILQERGVDVGLISSSNKTFSSECFIADDGDICTIEHTHTQEISVKENAIIESYFLPGKTPASYRYENKDGLKFFVLAFNNFNLDGGFNANYLNNYYRQSGLISAITWLSGKKLPVTVTKNPNLYVLASKDEQGNCSIAFANVSIDDVYDEFIYLDGNYALAESIGFDGEFLGDKIKVNRIEPYGFVAFKLEKSL